MLLMQAPNYLARLAGAVEARLAHEANVGATG
jgi:hypothetical protein